MVESTPLSTAEDFRVQVNILSATLTAVRDILGQDELAAAADLVDRLIEKGLAAGLDVREARALRRVMP
jgi:hypothetical protein